MQGNLSIEQTCRLASVSRAGFYRSLQGTPPPGHAGESQASAMALPETPTRGAAGYE